jgi:hypothetical protein
MEGTCTSSWDEARIRKEFAEQICFHGSDVLKWKTIDNQLAKVIFREMKNFVPTYNAMELTNLLFR